MLKPVEHSFGSPHANLAWDDALLAKEQESLRLWENPAPFVVLGRSGKAEQDVHLDFCQREGIPVLRRSSGGGTVLQGPGCLNYTLVLSLARRPELTSVMDSYSILLRGLVDALSPSVPPQELTVKGTDILLEGRKVSGNAQRRTRGWLLHHGTLLYNAMDLQAVERILREPARQPPHRNRRTHGEFLTKLALTRQELLTRFHTFADLLSATAFMQ